MTAEEPPPSTAPPVEPVRIPVSLVIAAVVLFWPLAIPAALAANRAARAHGAGDEGEAAGSATRARRLAVAAVGVGVIVVLAVAGGLVAAVVKSSEAAGPAAAAVAEPGALRTPVREATRTTSVHASDLRVGECFDPEGDVMSDVIDGSDLLVVDVVPCDQPHAAEVVDAWSLIPSEWPEEEELYAAVGPECIAAFEALLGEPDDRSPGLVETWYPPIGSGTERVIYCVFVPPAPVTGSLQDDAAELLVGV